MFYQIPRVALPVAVLAVVLAGCGASSQTVTRTVARSASTPVVASPPAGVSDGSAARGLAGAMAADRRYMIAMTTPHVSYMPGVRVVSASGGRVDFSNLYLILNQGLQSWARVAVTTVWRDGRWVALGHNQVTPIPATLVNADLLQYERWGA